MTYTLTGRYALGDLTGRDAAQLRFTPSTTIVGDDNIVLPAPVLVTLDADGAFSVDLVGTDDADYAPSGWVWTVEERMTGGRAPWSFELTADSDLADVTVVVTPPEYDKFTLTVADTITGDPGTAADVTITGAPPGQSLEFTIPRGTIVTVGDTITGAPGTDAAVADVDAGVDVELEFTIPAPQTVLNGTTAPGSGLGNDGDFYIDTATSNLYGPKAAGAWPAPVSLVGAPSSLYNAHTILAATTDNTPAPVTVGASTLVGRAASGNIAALSVADVRTLVGTTRITRPLTDDRLVEVWNGSAWSVVDYQSGVRSVFADPTNGWTGLAIRIRRSGMIVFAEIWGPTTVDDAKTSNVIYTLPYGFRPTSVAGIAEFAHPRAAKQCLQVRSNGVMEFPFAITESLYMHVQWPTIDAIPDSLPGTLVSAAPA
jgi:hypothetical protein